MHRFCGVTRAAKWTSGARSPPPSLLPPWLSKFCFPPRICQQSSILERLGTNELHYDAWWVPRNLLEDLSQFNLQPGLQRLIYQYIVNSYNSAYVCAVGHKSHDPCFHPFLMKAGFMIFGAHSSYLLCPAAVDRRFFTGWNRFNISGMESWDLFCVCAENTYFCLLCKKQFLDRVGRFLQSFSERWNTITSLLRTFLLSRGKVPWTHSILEGIDICCYTLNLNLIRTDSNLVFNANKSRDLKCNPSVGWQLRLECNAPSREL